MILKTDTSGERSNAYNMGLEVKEHSLLSGSIWKGLLHFTVPILLGQLFQQLYSAADALIVGNYIGKEALAAVSSSSNLILMLIGLLNGVAIGAAVLIAKCYGAGDYDDMRGAIHTNITIAILGGLLMSIVGVTMAPLILRWMKTPENVLPNSIAYFRTYFMGMLAVFLYNVCMGIFNATGDSKRPLYYLMLSSAINIGLDLLFVAVFRWGVASAAVATVISQAVSVALCIRRMVKPEGLYRLDIRKLGIQRKYLKPILKFGLPSGIQNALNGFANVLVQSHINVFGSNAMAGSGAYTKIQGFVFLPIASFAMGLSTFVGQNLGAKQYERVKAGVRVGAACSLAIAGAIGIAVFFLAPELIKLFSTEPAVMAFGIQQARIECFFYTALAMTHSMAGVFRGAGKSIVPMVTMLGMWCAFRVTYITVAVKIWNDISAVYSAFPITWILSAVVLVIYYYKANWIHNLDTNE